MDRNYGVHTYYGYLEKFGLLAKTGIDIPGEANSIFLKEEKAGPVELATISFGQRFEVTPIQMIQMVGTIANGGKRVYPRILKAILDSETGKKEGGWKNGGSYTGTVIRYFLSGRDGNRYRM